MIVFFRVEDSEESESSLTEVSPETLASLDSYLPGGVNIIGVAFLGKEDDEDMISLDYDLRDILQGT